MPVTSKELPWSLSFQYNSFGLFFKLEALVAWWVDSLPAYAESQALRL